MDEVEIDVEQVGLAVLAVHHMLLPDLVEQGAGR